MPKSSPECRIAKDRRSGDRHRPQGGVPWNVGGLCRAAEPGRADRNPFLLGISDRPARLQAEETAARRGLRFLVMRSPAAQCRSGGAAQPSLGPRCLSRGGAANPGGGRDLAIAGHGVAIDWLVKMVRLPAGRMLDHRLTREHWDPADIYALADRLARFFATARRVNIPPPVYLARIRAECRDSRRALLSTAVPSCSTQRNTSCAGSRPSSTAAKTCCCSDSTKAG